MTYFVGIDVGGTFTDCVAIGTDGTLHHAKALSTRPDPIPGMIDGLGVLAEALGCDLDRMLSATDRLAHGTTIGTNLVVERKGARVGLIATAGHGDALLMMRGAGGTAGRRPEEFFAPGIARPPVPIVPRPAILEIEERIDRDGRVIVALDMARARERIAAWLDAIEPEAVAIALLWSIRHAAHERAVAEIVRELRPGLFVSVSSDVSPRLGEYERTVAAVINAYVGPLSSAYLGKLSGELAQRGLGDPLLVMQSNGGVVDARTARESPLALIDSGPAGGLSGAAALARAAGHHNVIATDMGGTSFDVGLIVNGQPLIATERTIGQYTYLLPHIDVRSIACGGGSIASVNQHTRSLVVGPESAGSQPGPACYGRGGDRPTVTDADVVLGLLRPEAFLDGTMALDAGAAQRAVGNVADALGLAVEEAAAGILRINNSNAALLIRERTIQQGHDPRDFVIYAFGGAGAVHAFGFAAELGVREIVIPLGNGASTLSAYGIAAADTVRFFESECELRTPFDSHALASAVARAEADARAAFGEVRAITRVERTLLMRYAGQLFQSIPIPLPDGELGAADIAALQGHFEADYEELYGSGAKIVFQSAEAFAIRVRIAGRKGFAPCERLARCHEAPVVREPAHRVFWPGEMRWIETVVYDGCRLHPGHAVAGPALVELPHTTVAVAPGQSLAADRFGSLVLTLGADALGEKG